MSYKFQSGDATLSGSVTLVNYQDLLFETDAGSNVGTAAKAAGIVYADRLTASVAVTASAVYANKFYGNGSGLTGISSDSVDVSDSSANSEFRLVGVPASGDGVTLTTMDTAADRITMNAQTGKLTLAGALQVGALTSGRLPLVSTSGLINDNAVITYGVGRELEGYNYIALSSSVSGSAYLGDGLLYLADNTATDMLVVNKAGGISIGDDGSGNEVPAISISLGSTGSAGSLNKGQIIVNGINKAGTAGPKGAGVVRLSGSGATFAPANWGGQKGEMYGALQLGAADSVSGDMGTEAGVQALKLPAAFGGDRILRLNHKDGIVYLTGSQPFSWSEGGEKGGVELGSTLLAGKKAGFLKDVHFGQSTGDVVYMASRLAAESGGDQILVSSSMTALNVNSKNSGGNSFMGIGGMLLGHTGGGNALVKLQTQGGAGTVSGSENADFGGRLQAAANKFVVNSNGNVTIDGATLSLTASGQIFTGLELHAAKNKFKVTSGGAVTGVSFAASNGNVTADGNVSASVNLLGQRVSVDGNVVAGNNLSASNVALVNGGLQAAANKFTVDSSANVQFKGGLTAAGLGNATVALGTDLMIINDGAGGVIKNTSLADYATAIAGAGLTATAGVLSTDAQSVNAIGNANALLAEGTNYLSASLNADRTYRTPVNPAVGDIIRIKAGSAAQMDTHKMILSASGLHQIDGERLINIQSAYAGVSMICVSTGQWRIF